MKLHLLGRRLAAAHPGLTPDPEPPGTTGQGRSRAGGARDHSPLDSHKNPGPSSVVKTKLSSKAGAPQYRDPESRAGTLCGPRLPLPAPGRPHFVPPERSVFLCCRRPRNLGVRTGQCGSPYLIRGRELQLIDIERRHQGNGVEAILQQWLLRALLPKIVPQLHHGSERPEAAACAGRAAGSQGSRSRGAAQRGALRTPTRPPPSLPGVPWGRAAVTARFGEEVEVRLI